MSSSSSSTSAAVSLLALAPGAGVPFAGVAADDLLLLWGAGDGAGGGSVHVGPLTSTEALLGAGAPAAAAPAAPLRVATGGTTVSAASSQALLVRRPPGDASATPVGAALQDGAASSGWTLDAAASVAALGSDTCSVRLRSAASSNGIGTRSAQLLLQAGSGLVGVNAGAAGPAAELDVQGVLLCHSNVPSAAAAAYGGLVLRNDCALAANAAPVRALLSNSGGALTLSLEGDCSGAAAGLRVGAPSGALALHTGGGRDRLVISSNGVVDLRNGASLSVAGTGVLDAARYLCNVAGVSTTGTASAGVLRAVHALQVGGAATVLDSARNLCNVACVATPGSVSAGRDLVLAGADGALRVGKWAVLDASRNLSNVASLTCEGAVVAGAASLSGNLDVQGEIRRNGAPLSLSLLSVPSSIIPDAHLAYDIGAADRRFRDLYIAGTTIDMGGTQLSRTDDGDLQVTDRANNGGLAKLVVDEVQLGPSVFVAGGAGGGGTTVTTTRLRKNARTNAVEIMSVTTDVGTRQVVSETPSDPGAATPTAFGSEQSPLDGGSVAIDTSLSLSATVELSAAPGALDVSLLPQAHFGASAVGRSGAITLVERCTTGRTLNVDPRIHLASEVNSVATGFPASSAGGIAGTTVRGLSTSPAPAGGFAVDMISYTVSKVGYALGTYQRFFRCVPPTWAGAIPAQAGRVAAPGDWTLDVASYVQAGPYAGALFYYAAPAAGSAALPATVTMDAASGALTVARHSGYSGSVVITVKSTGGALSATVALDVAPYYPPTIAAAPAIPASVSTALGAYTTPAPALAHPLSHTGPVAWSVPGSVLSAVQSAGGAFDAATGQFTFPQHTAFSGGITLTATGPAAGAFAALSDTTTFACSISPWDSPHFATDLPEGAAPAAGNTATGAYVLAPAIVEPLASTGAITWAVSPSNLLAPFFDYATGRLTFPPHTTLAKIVGARITATGAAGAQATDTFDVVVQAWDTPAIAAFTPSAMYYTGPAAVSIPLTQTSANMGAPPAWSLATSPSANPDVSIGATSGVVTVAQGAAAISGLTVTVTCTGPTGIASAPLSFVLNTALWATPAVSLLDQSGDSTGAAFATAQPTTLAANTGTLTWSLSPASTSYRIAAATGAVTVDKGVAVPETALTVTATGPTGLSGSASFKLTVTVAKLTSASTSNAAMTSVTVTWTAPSDSTLGYVKVTWGTGGTSGKLTSGTSYTATGLTAGTSYTFTVTPYTAADVAGAAVTASATTLTDPMAQNLVLDLSAASLSGSLNNNDAVNAWGSVFVKDSASAAPVFKTTGGGTSGTLPYVVFDQTTSNHGLVNGATFGYNLLLNDGFTMMMYVKLTGTGLAGGGINDEFSRLFNMKNSVDTRWLELSRSGTNLSFAFGTSRWNDPTNIYMNATAVSGVTSAWAMYSFRYIHSTNAASVWRNGVQLATAARTGTMTVPWLVSTVAGDARIARPVGGDPYCNMQLSAFKLWERPLTDAEMATLTPAT
jgi:hypothetical protein